MADDLSDRDLDALPFAVVCLDADRRVIGMNRVAAETGGIQRWRAVGRDFLKDVAPAMQHAIRRRTRR